ncbi:hypothetical protein [Rugamonas apoptosis]|uniref:Uncharacterized protein n=1 Tax=Rugamonas apoptosis TaxID=2758570 RepID=A0A7W2FC52_9BURK|nr:hypothetical protein [Rugamonas apoptosis]MBA5688884.1 hypothetical protein [Rugamonas apoptosis]
MRNPFTLSPSQIADELLFPGPLHMGMASGVFVQLPSTDESAQFFWDLAPMLEAGGMRVMVVDAARLQAEDGLSFLSQLVRDRCDPARAGIGKDFTFADALANILNVQPLTIALLLGGAQRLSAEADERILKAIKAARDMVNLEPSAAGRFRMVATWILPADPCSYVENRRSAFYGATAVRLPAVDRQEASANTTGRN